MHLMITGKFVQIIEPFYIDSTLISLQVLLMGPLHKTILRVTLRHLLKRLPQLQLFVKQILRVYCNAHLKLIFKNRIPKYVYCCDFSFWFYNLLMSHLKVQPQPHLAF